MGAMIYLNGQVLGQATDQFLRYQYPVKHLLQLKNTLTVAFDSNIDCGGRWMACTGGWDWAPYSDTTQEGSPGSAATFTKGKSARNRSILSRMYPNVPTPQSM